MGNALFLPLNKLLSSESSARLLWVSYGSAAGWEFLKYLSTTLCGNKPYSELICMTAYLSFLISYLKRQLCCSLAQELLIDKVEGGRFQNINLKNKMGNINLNRNCNMYFEREKRYCLSFMISCLFRCNISLYFVCWFELFLYLNSHIILNHKVD